MKIEDFVKSKFYQFKIIIYKKISRNLLTLKFTISSILVIEEFAYFKNQDVGAANERFSRNFRKSGKQHASYFISNKRHDA